MASRSAPRRPSALYPLDDRRPGHGLLLLAGHRKPVPHALSDRTGDLCRGTVSTMASATKGANLPSRGHTKRLCGRGTLPLSAGPHNADWLPNHHFGKNTLDLEVFSGSTADFPVAHAHNCVAVRFLVAAH